MQSSLKILILFYFIVQLHQSYAQNFPAEHWKKVEHPVFYGWDAGKLNAIEEYVIDSTATTAMMIIQNGKLVYEYGAISENSYIASCRKSILAMLYGKHVENGSIQLDKSLKDLGITYDGLLLENEKKATVKDIISSRSGVYLPASNPGDMIHLAPKRGSVIPGEQWVYNNWDFNMAGHIFEQETQKNIYDEIESQLALPLQMEDWDRSLQEKSGDVLITDVLAYHMYFSARDMARMGLLMLHKGKWGKQQLIPENWVRDMVTPSSSFEELDRLNPRIKNKFTQFSYGYMWWLWDTPKNSLLEGAYSAQGAWGQNITILPKMNTVIVIKTNDRYLRQKGDHGLIIDRIARAYDPTQYANLQRFSHNLATHNISAFTKDYRNTPPQFKTIDFQTVLNQLGYSYMEQGDHESALAIFQLNAEQYPSSWLVYDALGEVFFHLKDYEESLKHFQKALSLNTNNQWNYNERLEYLINRLKLKK